MKELLLKTLKIVAPLALGVFLIYLSFSQFDDDQVTEIKLHITHADYRWIVLGITLALASHLARAWRWNYMLKAIGHQPTFLTNVVAIGTGYAMNLIIPRSGEVARAMIVNRIDNVPVDKAIGTIIAERVLDLIILLIITALAMIVSGDVIFNFFWDHFKYAFAKANTTSLIIYTSITLALCLLGYWLLKRYKPLSSIKLFVIGLKDGFITIWTMDQKWLYLCYTLFIWVMYLLMFYVSIFAIPGTATLSLGAILSAFVAGSFAVAFTNGGFGAYPYFIAQVLLLFGLSQTLGTSLGWILWLSQTALILLYGLVSFMLLSVNNSKSDK